MHTSGKSVRARSSRSSWSQSWEIARVQNNQELERRLLDLVERRLKMKMRHTEELLRLEESLDSDSSLSDNGERTSQWAEQQLNAASDESEEERMLQRSRSADMEQRVSTNNPATASGQQSEYLAQPQCDAQVRAMEQQPRLEQVPVSERQLCKQFIGMDMQQQRCGAFPVQAQGPAQVPDSQQQRCDVYPVQVQGPVQVPDSQQQRCGVYPVQVQGPVQVPDTQQQRSGVYLVQVQGPVQVPDYQQQQCDVYPVQVQGPVQVPDSQQQRSGVYLVQVQGPVQVPDSQQQRSGVYPVQVLGPVQVPDSQQQRSGVYLVQVLGPVQVPDTRQQRCGVYPVQVQGPVQVPDTQQQRSGVYPVQVQGPMQVPDSQQQRSGVYPVQVLGPVQVPDSQQQRSGVYPVQVQGPVQVPDTRQQRCGVYPVQVQGPVQVPDSQQQRSGVYPVQVLGPVQVPDTQQQRCGVYPVQVQGPMQIPDYQQKRRGVYPAQVHTQENVPMLEEHKCSPYPVQVRCNAQSCDTYRKESSAYPAQVQLRAQVPGPEQQMYGAYSSQVQQQPHFRVADPAYPVMRPEQMQPSYLEGIAPQQVSTVCSIVSNAAQNAARHVWPKKLPTFSGDPEEWPVFIRAYEDSTIACGFTAVENAIKLEECLRGPARELIRPKLRFPNATAAAIETMRELYGKPQLLLKSLLTKVRRAEVPRADRLDSLIRFGLVVQELCDHIVAANMISHLNNPTLLDELVEKLPAAYKMEWSDFSEKYEEP
uniref:uncharacterized protein LOC125907471 isoform X2 n=1 Tax=Anopheles coluzzii TaxID=1518534 RepID=UPI0020FFDCA1|nr:uncharacterized protein LOC125907471 isoform X2 [Anopheles coluzzii]